MIDYRQKLQEAVHSRKNDNSADVKKLYNDVCGIVMEHIRPHWNTSAREGRRACYLSAEFLIGRMVYSNLFNLGLLGETQDIFRNNGLDPNMFEQIDDCALGNGGLGRLAACFLDSAATHGLALDGYGIRYRYGLFKQ
jgi:starch phosphorylase